jgi:PadR family transcriptional regulator PadR
VQLLSNQSGGLLQLKEGTLYPILYRLEEQGLLQSTWEVRGRGVPRRYYRLVEAGRLTLQERAAEWKQLTSVMYELLKGVGSDHEGSD